MRNVTVVEGLDVKASKEFAASVLRPVKKIWVGECLASWMMTSRAIPPVPAMFSMMYSYRVHRVMDDWSRIHTSSDEDGLATEVGDVLIGVVVVERHYNKRLRVIKCCSDKLHTLCWIYIVPVFGDGAQSRAFILGFNKGLDGLRVPQLSRPLHSLHLPCASPHPPSGIFWCHSRRFSELRKAYPESAS